MPPFFAIYTVNISCHTTLHHTQAHARGKNGKELGKNGERMGKIVFGPNPRCGGKWGKLGKWGKQNRLKNCQNHGLGGNVENEDKLGKMEETCEETGKMGGKRIGQNWESTPHLRGEKWGEIGGNCGKTWEMKTTKIRGKATQMPDHTTSHYTTPHCTTRTPAAAAAHARSG